MPGLIETGDVLTRLNEIQGLNLPASITAPKIEGFITGATGELLSAMNISTNPLDGTPARSALDEWCLDLVLIAIKRAIFWDQPDMLEVLRRQRVDIFTHASDVAETLPGGSDSGAFLDIAGAGG